MEAGGRARTRCLREGTFIFYLYFLAILSHCLAESSWLRRWCVSLCPLQTDCSVRQRLRTGACSAELERVIAVSMTHASMRRKCVVAGGPIFAVVLLGLCPKTDAFTVPSVPGLSAFTGSTPATTVGSSKLVSLSEKRISPLHAKNGVTGVSMAAVRNPQLIGTTIPRSWTEGTDFIRDGRGISKGDIVIISRSDGRCTCVFLRCSVQYALKYSGDANRAVVFSAHPTPPPNPRIARDPLVDGMIIKLRFSIILHDNASIPRSLCCCV